MPYLMFAYNTAVQATRKFSFFRLLYGLDPGSTIDTIFPYTSLPHNFPLADATCGSEEYRKISRCRTAESQAAAKLRYDEQHHHVEHQDGDLVRLWVPVHKTGLCEKPLCQYLGPYRVLRRLSPLTYLVEPVEPSKDRRHAVPQSHHICHDLSLTSEALPSIPFMR